LNFKQDGFLNGAVITLLIAGLVLGGLLAYGSMTGQELPIWPAIAVALVNLVAAAKIIMDTKKARRQQQKPPSSSTPDNQQQR